jgi:heme exporter protein A
LRIQRGDELTPPAVSARGIWKRYSGTWALRDLSLLIKPGEAICLVGPNGSGKTTLLRVLATAANPSRGEVAVFGVSSASQPDDVRRRVGLVVAQAYVYGELTAAENLRFAAAMYGRKATATELDHRLAAVGLQAAAHTRVRTFSQGMLQRLALARAALNDAPLMLLDEPYTALDAAGLRLVDNVIADYRAAGRTLIIATHRPERALVHCDRGVALDRGRLVYDGPTSGLVALAAAAEPA